MAKTVTGIQPGGASANPLVGKVPADRKEFWANIAGDTSYPTGGYPIAPSDLGFFEQIDYLAIVNESVTAWAASWNRSTQKLQLVVMSTGAEVANTTDVHTFNCDVFARGI